MHNLISNKNCYLIAEVVSAVVPSFPGLTGKSRASASSGGLDAGSGSGMTTVTLYGATSRNLFGFCKGLGINQNREIRMSQNILCHLRFHCQTLSTSRRGWDLKGPEASHFLDRASGCWSAIRKLRLISGGFCSKKTAFQTHRMGPDRARRQDRFRLQGTGKSSLRAP